MVQVNTVCGEVHSSAGFLRASVQSAGTEGRGAHVRTADFFFFFFHLPLSGSGSPGCSPVSGPPQTRDQARLTRWR